eukprot:INCI18111.1.p1 GENE.INCI18111.1~~INCI18111.1.p1  ORF type:complete len:453 (-),score=80.77 INCI18111.1:182-1540(-)
MISKGKAVYDLVVVGGGVVGAATAWAAARAGARVCLLEQFQRCHDRGSSHGDGRIYRFAYAEDHYARMMHGALRGWRELENATGHRLLETTGGLNIFPPDAPHAAELEATYRLHGLKSERLNTQELSHRFPQFNPHAELGWEAVFQPDGGIVRATLAVQALLEAAERTGFADVLEHQDVSSVVPHGPGQGVSVFTKSGDVVVGGAAVVAAGGWVAGLAAQLGLRLPVFSTMETVAHFVPRDPSSTVDYSFRSMPTFIPHVDNGILHHGYYGLPEIDVPGVKMSAHYCGPHMQQSDLDGDRQGGLSHPRSKEVIASCKRLLADLFPTLDDTPSFSATCLYTTTPDHDFILDRLPPADSGFRADAGVSSVSPVVKFKAAPPEIDGDIVFASCCSGHGFKFGPVLGDMAMSLALDKQDWLATRHPDLKFSDGDWAKFSATRPSLRQSSDVVAETK